MMLRRLAVLLTCAGLLAAFGAAEAAPAKVLTKARATRAAYQLAQQIGYAEGAVYAVAGYCKRRSAYRFTCWAGIVWSDYSGAAQRVAVRMRGKRVTATRFGRVYTGNLGGGQESGQSGGEWAICGIHQSVCIGS